MVALKRWIWLPVAAAAACDSPADPGRPGAIYDILYESFVSNLVLLQSIDGGQPVAPAIGVGQGFEPAAFPDGSGFVYVRLDQESAGDLVLVNRANGTTSSLTSGEDFDEQPAVAPDGQRIAFVSDRDGPGDIHVINRDGTGRQSLTSDPSPATWFERSPAWSPDGSRIAFASNRNGTTHVWVMNSDGSSARRLTSNAAFEEDPAWSPDGQRIVYFEVTDETPALVVANADGSARQVLFSRAGAVTRMPAWSPDGRFIAFAFGASAGINPEIFTIKPDGTELRRRTFDTQSRGAREPAWIKRAFHAETRDAENISISGTGNPFSASRVSA